MKPQLKPCRSCNRTPAVVPLDVCENPVFYTRCKCGICTTWWSTQEKAAEDWNGHYGVDKPRHARAMSALMRAKEAYGCA